MTVCSVDKNPGSRTLVITSEFTASITNVWRLWADPHLLERWWGPPGVPARFEDYELAPGATITYSMSVEESGEGFDGRWRVVEADAPRRLVVEDADVDDDGTPTDGHGMTRLEVDIEPLGDDTTRMTVTTHFDSVEGMEQSIAMGVLEGMRAALSQIDALLEKAA